MTEMFGFGIKNKILADGNKRLFLSNIFKKEANVSCNFKQVWSGTLDFVYYRRFLSTQKLRFSFGIRGVSNGILFFRRRYAPLPP